MPAPHATEAAQSIDGALGAGRVPGVAATAPPLPVVLVRRALTLGVRPPCAAIRVPPLLLAERVVPVPAAAGRKLDGPPAAELVVIGDGRAVDRELVCLGTVVGNEVGDVDGPALEVGDVEELSHKADRGLDDGYMHAKMLDGVLDTGRVAIEGIVAVRGDRRMILVVGGVTGEGEVEVIVGNEEGGIAEIIEGVRAYERHDMLTFIL